MESPPSLPEGQAALPHPFEAHSNSTGPGTAEKETDSPSFPKLSREDANQLQYQHQHQPLSASRSPLPAKLAPVSPDLIRPDSAYGGSGGTPSLYSQVSTPPIFIWTKWPNHLTAIL